MRASEIMSEGVLSIDAGATVLEAAQLLVSSKVSAMTVVDAKGLLVGILSEADLVRGIAAQPDLKKAMAEARARQISEVMTRDVVTASGDASLSEVAQLMTSRNVKRVPILQDGSIVGLVSRVDLLQALISLGPEAYAEKPEAATTADQRLRAKVMAVLQQHDWSRTRRSDVVVANGVVHLWGTVASDAVRKSCVDAVRMVPEVTSVNEHLHVVRSLHPGSR